MNSVLFRCDSLPTYQFRDSSSVRVEPVEFTTNNLTLKQFFEISSVHLCQF